MSRPIWSTDSRAIYYRKSDPDGAVEIWKTSVDGGSPLLQIRSDDPDRSPGSDASLFSVVNGKLYTPVTEHRSVLGIATLVQR